MGSPPSPRQGLAYRDAVVTLSQSYLWIQLAKSPKPYCTIFKLLDVPKDRSLSIIEFIHEVAINPLVFFHQPDHLRRISFVESLLNFSLHEREGLIAHEFSNPPFRLWSPR